MWSEGSYISYIVSLVDHRVQPVATGGGLRYLALRLMPEYCLSHHYLPGNERHLYILYSPSCPIPKIGMVQVGKLATAAAGVINIHGVHGIGVVDVEADGKVFTD